MPVDSRPRVETVPLSLVEAYRDIPPATIGHYLKTGFMDPTVIKPVWRGIRMVGRAYTVRMPANDNFLNREPLKNAAPGDVIVIVRDGGDTQACFGEMTALNAKVKGLAGIIIDGCITDVMEIEEMKFPAFARGASAVLAPKVGNEGAVNVPVACGGVIVHPGDLIVADDNGIVVMSAETAEAIHHRARRSEDQAPAMRQWLQAGNFIGDFKG